MFSFPVGLAAIGDIARPGFLAFTRWRLRKAPPHHHRLAHAVRRGPHHRGNAIGKDGGKRLKVAGEITQRSRVAALVLVIE